MVIFDLALRIRYCTVNFVRRTFFNSYTFAGCGKNRELRMREIDLATTKLDTMSFYCFIPGRLLILSLLNIFNKIDYTSQLDATFVAVRPDQLSETSAILIL